MYAVQQDMVTRFGNAEMVQITNDAMDATAIDATVMDTALQDASDIIDGYLQGRYPLPLASAPKILNIYCCDIARALLFKTRITDEVKDRRDAAIRYLEKVSSGSIGIGLDGGDAEVVVNDMVEVHSAGNAFARRDRGGF